MRNPANKPTIKQTNRHTKVIAISRFSRDNYKTNTEIKPINKYKGSVNSFDDMLRAQNSSQIGDFYTERKA